MSGFRTAFSVDPRLLIGIGLVAASVAGVVGIVSATDETVAVYSARATLTPGDRVDAGDLDVRRVRLSDASTLYVVPGDVPVDGFLVTRAVDAGELLPVSAVGSTQGSRMASIVLDVGGELAASLVAGAQADVWSSAEIENGKYGPPTIIVSGATVVRLVTSDSLVTGGKTTAIEVLVPKSTVSRVLEAVANSDAMSIVPADIPGLG